jgi:hypothetical protein
VGIRWRQSLVLASETRVSVKVLVRRRRWQRGCPENRGEMRDRSYEHQIHKASGLNFLVAAIILWNTKYLEASITELRKNGVVIPNDIIKHM